MTRESELIERVPGLLVGSPVRAQDGTRLGRVTKVRGSELELERGVFRRRRYRLGYDEITSAFGGSVYVARGPAALTELRG